MWSREFLASSSSSGGGGGGWLTLAFLALIFLWQFARRLLLSFRNNDDSTQQSSITTTSSSSSSSSSREHDDDGISSDIITDLDLKVLMDNLDDNNDNHWESVVVRRNDSISYSVNSCKPKEGGPLKYLSTTVFHSCSPQTLRDFYMDNLYRKEWDKTLIQHDQLALHQPTGTEIGRTIKKFPLLTPREYVLAWRLWEGADGTTYYCYSKECDHPLAPRRNKYVRVSLFRSGWRIREVPGRNSCQIKMVHQEDAGLNVEMAKMIFAKGIWSYVCKMDKALRKYSAINRIQLTSTPSAITFVQKVPLPLESTGEIPAHHPEVSEECNKKKLSRRPSKKVIANGLIIAGGVICLARGHTNFSAKVAMAYVLSKLTKRRQPLH